jgi:hypothetical protein
MRLLISTMLLLLIVGIAASVQSGNSTGKNIMSGGVSKNFTNQTNNSINQTNITNRMNSSNQTNISVVRRSVLGGNGINRSAMVASSNPFGSNPASSTGNAAAPLGEGMAMETPAQAAFGSYVF